MIGSPAKGGLQGNCPRPRSPERSALIWVVDTPLVWRGRLEICWTVNGLHDLVMTVLPIRAVLAMTLTAAALALGASATARADEPPLPPPRPPELGTPAKPIEPPPPPPQAPKAEATSTCLAKLIVDGASAEAATAPPASAEGCGIAAPVRLSSITAEGER